MSKFGSAVDGRRRPVPTGRAIASSWWSLPIYAGSTGMRWSTTCPAGYSGTVPTFMLRMRISKSVPRCWVSGTSTASDPLRSGGRPPRTNDGDRARCSPGRSGFPSAYGSPPVGYSTRSSSTSWPTSSSRITAPASRTSRIGIRGGVRPIPFSMATRWVCTCPTTRVHHVDPTPRTTATSSGRAGCHCRGQPRRLSPAVKTQAERADSARKDVRFDIGSLDHRQVGDLSGQSLHQHAQLEPGQRGAQAEVGTEPERHMGVVGPTDIECIGLVEHNLVTVGRRIEEDHPVPRFHPHPTDGGRLHCRTEEVVQRGHPPDHLLHRAGDEGRVVAHGLPLVGMVTEFGQ